MRRKLQIFVSSTFTDLIPERQAAVSAILKAGHIPAGMELFTAGDKSQMETIKRWIDESDVYMLILAGRYGSVEASSGISYTELEYDYAIEQGKPIFSVVIDNNYLEEKVKCGGTVFFEKENPQQLKQFREKVLSKISSFFKSDADIKLCVHESLADFRDNPELKGWISASDYEDPRFLHEEILKLREEIERLEEVSDFSKSKIKTAGSKTNFQEEIRYLSETIVKIPDNLREKAKAKEISLHELFFRNRDPLISGIDNSPSANDVENFFYYSLMPKLMLHDLMANEKIAGVRYRRGYVTPKGLSVLAEIERTKTTEKAEKTASACKDEPPKS